MKSKRTKLVAAVLFLASCCAWNKQVSAQFTGSLDERIEVLADAVSESAITQDYFLGLGPQTIPIATKKLLQSLSEKGTPEKAGNRMFMDKTLPDQIRLKHQRGLITMLEIGLEKMPLSAGVKTEAYDALCEALRSPYSVVRGDAVECLGRGVGLTAMDRLLPLLSDPEETVRDQAITTLAKYGDRATANKMQQALTARRRTLTRGQINADHSLSYADETVKKLTAESNGQ